MCSQHHVFNVAHECLEAVSCVASHSPHLRQPPLAASRRSLRLQPFWMPRQRLVLWVETHSSHWLTHVAFSRNQRLFSALHTQSRRLSLKLRAISAKQPLRAKTYATTLVQRVAMASGSSTYGFCPLCTNSPTKSYMPHRSKHIP